MGKLKSEMGSVLNMYIEFTGIWYTISGATYMSIISRWYYDYCYFTQPNVCILPTTYLPPDRSDKSDDSQLLALSICLFRCWWLSSSGSSTNKWNCVFDTFNSVFLSLASWLTFEAADIDTWLFIGIGVEIDGGGEEDEKSSCCVCWWSCPFTGSLREVILLTGWWWWAWRG